MSGLKGIHQLGVNPAHRGRLLRWIAGAELAKFPIQCFKLGQMARTQGKSRRTEQNNAQERP